MEIEQLWRLEAQRQRALEVQAETRRMWAEDADFREARAVRVARRLQPTQRQALRLTFLRDSNNNKPNRWKRIRKKIQKRFLRPWSNQIPNPLVSANNNKRSELVRVTNIPPGDVGEECHTNFGRTPQGFDTIDFESTQMHARLK